MAVGAGALLIVAAVMATPGGGSAAAAEPGCRQPLGIYVLDGQQGTYRDGNIRDRPFVAGYAWRMSWRELEPEKGVYDFAPVDHIVARLVAAGQQLFLVRGRGGPEGPEPAYIAAEAAVTYDYRDPRGRALKRAVPWDPRLTDRFQAFVKALGDHPVPDPAAGGAPRPLRDHSVVSNVSLGVPGLDGVRERGVRLARLPGYTRDRLTAAVLAALRTATDQFPRAFVHLPFWKVSDGQDRPELWEHLRREILQEFDGVRRPRVGFRQDNLAASRDLKTGRVTGYPSLAFAEPLHRSRDSAYISFEALQSWKRPFRDPGKVANTVPTDGLRYAYEAFGSTFFQLYVADVDERSYWPALIEWDRFVGQAMATGRGCAGGR